jgi:hypothetical protein
MFDLQAAQLQHNQEQEEANGESRVQEILSLV